MSKYSHLISKSIEDEAREGRYLMQVVNFAKCKLNGKIPPKFRPTPQSKRKGMYDYIESLRSMDKPHFNQ
jgi:hypothetical protein